MNQITVYTSNHCRYCVMLKNFLSDQNISYQEVNVITNPAIMQQLVENTGQLGVPQTEVNGQWVVGYDPNSIMSALRK